MRLPDDLAQNMTALDRRETRTVRREHPFFHRGAIRDPAYFYGRRRETRLLLSLVRNAQSVSVLAQRRIGKTSFLLHVSHPTVLRRHGESPEQYAFAFVDCQGRSDLPEGDFCRLLLRSLVNGLGEQAGRADLAGDGQRRV